MDSDGDAMDQEAYDAETELVTKLVLKQRKKAAQVVSERHAARREALKNLEVPKKALTLS